MYVYLTLSQGMSHSEPQVHHEALVEELIEELRDRVAFLERSLERKSVEAERYQRIVAGLTQTNNHLATWLRELEPPGAPETATGGLQEGSERPRDTAEWPVRGGLIRPWWRRMFSG
jgi:superoxide dismutase